MMRRLIGRHFVVMRARRPPRLPTGPGGQAC